MPGSQRGWWAVVFLQHGVSQPGNRWKNMENDGLMVV